MFQFGNLERDVLELFRLIHSVKNSFPLISRIPLTVLSLIPDYYDEDFEYDAD